MGETRVKENHKTGTVAAIAETETSGPADLPVSGDAPVSAGVSVSTGVPLSNEQNPLPAEGRESPDQRASREDWLATLVDREIRRKEDALPGLFAHGVSFLCVSAGFIFLNLVTSRAHPWAFYPIAAWGIGMASHVMAFINKGRKAKLLMDWHPETEEGAKLVTIHAHARNNLAEHLTAWGASAVFLGGINLITSRSYPWAAIPMGLWGIGLLAHISTAIANTAIFRRRMKDLSRNGGASRIDAPRPTAAANGPSGSSTASSRAVASPRGGTHSRPAAKPREGDAAFNEYFRRADALRGELLEEISQSDELKSHFGGIEPFLNSFSSQIAGLCRKEADIADILEGESREEIAAHVAEMKAKSVKAKSASLKSQYEKSVAQFEGHLRSLSELEERKEAIGLQISSSVALLTQLKLDIARVKAMSWREDPASLSALRDKSREIASYMDDVASGYDEIEKN